MVLAGAGTVGQQSCESAVGVLAVVAVVAAVVAAVVVAAVAVAAAVDHWGVVDCYLCHFEKLVG